MRRLSITAVLLLISTATCANCDTNNDILQAHYTIKTIDISGSVTQQQQVLWRYGNTIAIDKRNENITEQWTRNEKGGLQLLKHFDQHQRSIEYQPSEIKSKKQGELWQLKRNMVSDKQLSSLTLLEGTEAGCESTQTRVSRDKKATLELIWLNELQLVKSYREVSSSGAISITLTSVSSETKLVAEKFKELSNYDTTDYADIGDNESDPFLLKMINLGFVEHSHSGFWNSDGQPIR